MKKILIGVIAVIVVAYGGYAAVERQQNARPTPDLYYDFYKTQDTTPEGKVGVFLVGLNTGEDYEPEWWKNIYDHRLHAIIPWPGRIFAGMDGGVALLDPHLLGLEVIGRNSQQVARLQFAVPRPVGPKLGRSAPGECLGEEHQQYGAALEHLRECVLFPIGIGGGKFGSHAPHFRRRTDQ